MLAGYLVPDNVFEKDAKICYYFYACIFLRVTCIRICIERERIANTDHNILISIGIICSTVEIYQL